MYIDPSFVPECDDTMHVERFYIIILSLPLDSNHHHAFHFVAKIFQLFKHLINALKRRKKIKLF